jgi:hypothetical protein
MDNEAEVILFEPAGVLNTGYIADERFTTHQASGFEELHMEARARRDRSFRPTSQVGQSSDRVSDPFRASNRCRSAGANGDPGAAMTGYVPCSKPRSSAFA